MPSRSIASGQQASAVTWASRLSRSAVTLLPGTAAAMCCSTGIRPSTCSLTACATRSAPDTPAAVHTARRSSATVTARFGRSP